MRERSVTSRRISGKELHTVSSTRFTFTSAFRYRLPYFSTSGVSLSGVSIHAARHISSRSRPSSEPAVHAAALSARLHQGLRGFSFAPAAGVATSVCTPVVFSSSIIASQVW